MNIAQTLRTMAATQPPLDDVAQALREFRDTGGTQSEALAVLEQLRAESEDKATEDFLLDMMDIVSGFCAERLRVW